MSRASLAMLAYDTRPNAAALKSHDDPELPPEPLALPPKRGEWKLRLAYGLSAIAILLSVGAWLGAPAPTEYRWLPTEASSSLPPPPPPPSLLGDAWSVPPLLGPSKPITHSWASPLCGQLAASVDAHGAFFSGRAVRRLELENPRLAPLVL